MSEIIVRENVTPGQDVIVQEKEQEENTVNPRLPLWITLIVIATVSFVTRVIRVNYSDGNTPVFDEKHYAPQAYQMLMNGGLEDNPGYGLVVHPPLGKALIAVGEFLFGYSPLGWRFTAILASVVIVTTLAMIVWKMTHSLSAVAVAGILGNTEGILHVTGRIGMLDIFLAMFVVLGVFCIVMDLSYNRSGTAWINRYWLLLSGVFFGMGMAVKMSGVFYPAVAGIVLVVTVMVTSRSVRTTVQATLAGLVFYLVVPVVVFALSYLPWASSENSVYRHAGDNVLASFLEYQTGVGEFHTSLLTSEGHTHPWESKPWHWLIGMRPMLYYTNPVDDAVIGSGDATEKIWLATNPAVWLLLVPVTVWLAYRLFRHQRDNHGIALAGIITGLLPWFVFYDRTMYLFYTATLAPFLILGIVLVLHDIVTELVDRGRIEETATRWVYGGYSAVVIVVFVLISPWLYGIPVSDEVHDSVEFVDPVPSATSTETASDAP